MHFHANFKRPRVGNFDVDLTQEFFQGFANHAKATIHMDVLRGVNDHHKIETLFKAFGRALRFWPFCFPRVRSTLMPASDGWLAPKLDANKLNTCIFVILIAFLRCFYFMWAYARLDGGN